MWILVLEGRMHDGPARRDVTTEGNRGAAPRHQVMSTDVERLMEVMCRAETATIRAPRKATTTVAAAATVRGARTLARSSPDRLRRICLALPGAWERTHPSGLKLRSDCSMHTNGGGQSWTPRQEGCMRSGHS